MKKFCAMIILVALAGCTGTVDTTIPDLVARVDSHDKILNGHDGELGNLTTMVGRHERDGHAINHALNKVTAEGAKTASELATLKSDYTSWKPGVDAGINKIPNLESSINTLQTSYSTVSTNLSTLENKVDTATADLTNKISVVDGRVTGVDNRVTTEINGVRSDLIGVTNRVGSVEAKADKLAVEKDRRWQPLHRRSWRGKVDDHYKVIDKTQTKGAKSGHVSELHYPGTGQLYAYVCVWEFKNGQPKCTNRWERRLVRREGDELVYDGYDVSGNQTLHRLPAKNFPDFNQKLFDTIAVVD